MALILGIETASTICSVALMKDGNLLAIRESTGVKEHSAALTGFIAEVFDQTGLKYSQLDAVAVSMGPGSYTGLRIGVSSAKGLCFALDKAFIAIDTLKSLAWQALRKIQEQGELTDDFLLVPMLDARRMEVYTAVYDSKLHAVEPVNALIVTEQAFESFSSGKLAYFGDGAEKCISVLSSGQNIIYIENVQLSAEAVCALAEEEYAKANFADVAYCEPFYLKDFVAGKPRVKGLYQ